MSLAVNVPGPVVAARLMEHGASVVKIEPPEGDPLFHHAPDWYARLTDSQSILRLDLKTREGKSGLDRRLARADLVITANRPATLKRLGLDFPSLHARFPRLCQLQIAGFPPPHDNAPGHDLSFQAAAGLVVDPPRMPFTLLADLAGAQRAATEAVLMLLHRQRTCEATCTRVFLAEAAESLAPGAALRLCGVDGPLGGGQPGYAVYPTKDGFIALAALEPRFLTRLKEALTIPSVSAVRLRKMFRGKTSARWEAWGRRHGIPVTAIHRRSGR